MWRVIQSAKILQSTTEPCKNAILAGGRIIPIARSWDDLENKPFGVKTEMGWVEILPEQSFTIGRKEGGYYRCSTLLETPFTIGTNYTVIINGQEYKCVAYGVEGNGIPAIGARVISGELVEFPFVIYGDGTPRPLLWSTELGTKINLAIYEEQEVEVVEPLDYKFMPEGYPKVEKKMVEIVPEQSVTQTDSFETYYGTALENIIFEFKEGHEYKVCFNGKEYTFIAEEVGGGNIEVGILRPDGFCVGSAEGFAAPISVSWSQSYGETITLAIYEKQEVITPLDPKFVVPVFYVQSVYDDNKKLRYNNGEEVSIEDVLKYGLNIFIYDTDTETMFRPHCLNKTSGYDYYSYGYMSPYLTQSGDDNYVGIHNAFVGTKPNVTPV